MSCALFCALSLLIWGPFLRFPSYFSFFFSLLGVPSEMIKSLALFVAILAFVASATSQAQRRHGPEEDDLAISSSSATGFSRCVDLVGESECTTAGCSFCCTSLVCVPEAAGCTANEFYASPVNTYRFCSLFGLLLTCADSGVL